MLLRTMLCPYCKHRLQTSAPDPIYCGPHRASVGSNEYPRVQMAPVDALPAGVDREREYLKQRRDHPNE